MRIYRTTVETRDYIAAAVRARSNHDVLTAGLGRVDRNDRPFLVPYAVESWEPDSNGVCEIMLSDHAGLIAWRGFVLAELDAGRGRVCELSMVESKLGITTELAFGFIKAVVKGSRARLTDGHDLSAGAEWVLTDGHQPEPRQRWARSAWRGRLKAHEVCAAHGLALPIRNKWQPTATALFWQPKVHVPAPVRVELSAHDEVCLAELMT